MLHAKEQELQGSEDRVKQAEEAAAAGKELGSQKRDLEEKLKRGG